MKKKWEKLLFSLCDGAGKVLMRYYGKTHDIRRKPGAGIVTEADGAAERFLLKSIFRDYPQSSIITEETGEYEGSELLWVIDPLDGTSNYAHGFPWFAVSIGIYEGDKALAGAVYHPVTKEFFFAESGKGAFLNGKRIRVSKCKSLRDSLLGTGFYYSKDSQLKNEIRIFHRMNQLAHAVRRPGSAALDLACVAAGRFDAFWERGLSPWDVAAGMLLVKEAGGKLSDYKGKETGIFDRELVASNGVLHRPMVEVIRRSDRI